MKITEEKITIKTCASEEHPEIFSSDPRDREIIEWLDENPVAFKIVTGTRSKAFGMSSCVYIGWSQRNNSVGAIIEKLKTLKREISGQGCFPEGPPMMGGTIFQYRAKFTFEHYEDKGFTGGFFQQ